MLHTRRILAAVAATGLLLSATPSNATTLSLAPLLPSATATSQGTQATFLRIDSTWHDSSVYWNDTLQQYGATAAPGYVRIGTLGWGSGLWGISDFRSVLAGDVASVASWSGRQSQINFGDGCYNGQWSGTWGAADLAPIFGAGVGCTDGNADPAVANEEDDWIASFTGYLRITDEDVYNFSVLYDDGFFFNLYGADGTLSIARDFLNARDRLGFATDLILSPGLYRYELGAYDRLEAGVVDLRWRRGDSTAWTLVPPEYLVAVAEPGTLALLAGGLIALVALARHTRRRAATGRDDA